MKITGSSFLKIAKSLREYPFDLGEKSIAQIAKVFARENGTHDDNTKPAEYLRRAIAYFETGKINDETGLPDLAHAWACIILALISSRAELERNRKG